MFSLGQLPVTVVGVVAREIADVALSFEYQQMVYHFVHEVAVVAHHDDTSLEVLQVFFQHLQSHDVQVVGRLVQHQEVWVSHQYRTEVQPAAFSPAQLVHIAVLRFGRKEEMLQEL